MRTISIQSIQKKSDKLSVVNISAFAKVAMWCGIYRFLLDIIYVRFIATRWAFNGFSYETPSFLSYLGSWCITILMAVCLTQMMKFRILSSFVLQCLLILAFLPGVVICTFMSEATAMYPYYLLYWFSLIVFFFTICYKTVRPIQFAVSEKTLFHISVFFFLICLFVWGVYARFHLQMDLVEVYDQRSIAAGFGMPLPLVYLFAGVQNCVPFLAVWALTQKKRSLFLINVAAQLMAFFSTGSKLALFALFIGILIYCILATHKAHFFTVTILAGASLLNVFSILESAFRNTYFLCDSIIRRNLFTPNLLNIYYFDFFSSHEYDYFRSTILKFLSMGDLYSDKIQKVIGGTYLHRPNMLANNGLFGDAFMNLGLLGMFLMPLLIVLLLRLFDICIGNSDLPMIFASAIYLIINLINSSFFTNLFSHGFIMLALLFCFLRKENSIILRLGR